MISKITLQCYVWMVFVAALVACSPLAPARTETPSATTSVPSSTPTLPPTETPTPEPQQPPACTFPLEQTTMEESKPEEYTFSEPRVVLSAPNGVFESIEWLPDSQQALVAQRVEKNRNEQIQTMELFNPRTVKVQVYATNKLVPYGNKTVSSGSPLWAAGLNAIIYPENILSSSSDANGVQINSSVVIRDLLRLSQGNPNEIMNIKDVEYKPFGAPHGWKITYIAVKPDGSQIVYSESNDESISRLYSRSALNGVLGEEQLLSVDIPQFKSGDYLFNYKILWRPNTSQLFFYDKWQTKQTTILDINSGKSCTLDFNAWVYSARWSPNGRYLAVIKSIEYGTALSTNLDLNILDTATGKIYQIDSKKVGLPELKDWRHFIGDFSWAPDNRHLIITGAADFVRTGTSITYVPAERLALADFISGEVDSLFPLLPVDSSWGNSLVWSPDGTKILVDCSVENAGRLCLISVQKTTQP